MTLSWQGVSLSDPIYAEIEASIRKTYPYSCVLYVDRVVNTSLEEKFKSRMENLKQKRGDNKVQVLRLFHGTKGVNINSIGENGFMVKANTRSAYGIGTYFSTAAGYSKDYTDTDIDDVSYMFVCDVLVGECMVGSGHLPLDCEKYDNFVNHASNPTIYVSPYDDGCMPRYLVAFHKNAK